VTEADEALTRANEDLDRGDVGAAISRLREYADALPLSGVAAVLGRAAAASGFDDMVEAAHAVVSDPESPQWLYQLGCSCVERGIASIAIPFLASALRHAPGTLGIVTELAAAYERDYRHVDAVAVLEANEVILRDWPERYLLAFNAIMAGDINKARSWAARLSTADVDWAPAQRRLTSMLDRAGLVGSLDDRTLRQWHFVLNASVLATIAPHGIDDGMNGRYAYLGDSAELCASTLARLKAAEPPASSVSLLPDRGSQILGVAAARILGLPTRTWGPDDSDTIVVAYDLNEVDPATLQQLRDRPVGSVLVEHACCWTDPPLVAADFVGLLAQHVVPPWGARLIAPPGEPVRQSEPDDRPADVIAEEIASATPSDDLAPGDTAEDLVAFIRSLGDAWPAIGPRDRMWSPGPVPSSRFL
jgi:hypothetical protein